MTSPWGDPAESATPPTVARPEPHIGEIVDPERPVLNPHPSHQWRGRIGATWQECPRCWMRSYFPGATRRCKRIPP